MSNYIEKELEKLFNETTKVVGIEEPCKIKILYHFVMVLFDVLFSELFPTDLLMAVLSK